MQEIRHEVLFREDIRNMLSAIWYAASASDQGGEYMRGFRRALECVARALDVHVQFGIPRIHRIIDGESGEVER